MTVFEDFCQSFTTGNLSTLVRVLDIELTNTFEANAITSAQRYIKSWIADARKGQPSYITGEHMRLVYHVLNSNQQAISVLQFSKMLARNGLESKVQRPKNGVAIRCKKIDWVVTDAQLDEYIEAYFKPEDQALLPKQAKA